VTGPAEFRRQLTADPRRRGASARRSLFNSTRLLVPRRARRDAGLLGAWLALIIVATMLALVIPRLVLDTRDQGAREAVAEAGSAADISALTAVGERNESVTVTSPVELPELARVITRGLPAGISRVLATTVTSAVSGAVTTTREGAVTGRVETRLGMLGADQERLLTVTRGRLPTATPEGDQLEVVVSEKVAAAASLDVDTVLALPAPAPGDPPGPFTTIRIVGIVSPDGVVEDSGPTACTPAWCDLPGFGQSADRTTTRSTRTIEVTLLATPDDLLRASALFVEPLAGTVRFRLDPARFTSDLVSRVIDETQILSANSSTITEDSTATVDVRSEFGKALTPYATRAAAAVAQMSLMIAGVYGVLAAVLLVLSRLIVLRRAGELALERARGASIASIAARSLVESVVIAVVGGAVGFGLSALAVPGRVLDEVPLVAVLAVAVLAPVAQTVASVWSEWSGRRQPANRSDRDRIESRARQRRIVLEAAIVALAVAALVSVRSRGLVSARTDSTDPLLASTPLLLATAVSILIVRVFPWIVRGLAGLAARGRGILGILGAAQARNALTAVPLIALTISVALVVAGGLMVDTVRAGQVDASWQRVGADVRVDGPTTVAEAESISARDGVDAASAILSTTSVEIDAGPAFLTATVLAVDRGYPALVRSLPTPPAPADGGASLRRLADDPDPTGPLPVVVNAVLADQFEARDVTMRFGDQNVPIRVVATTAAAPSGYLNAPFLYVDLAALSTRLGEDVDPSTLLVVGSGADAAAESVADASDTVLSRSTWLAERRGLALVSGVDRMMLLAEAAAALLAAVVLVTTVVAGARARARSLSLLRTMGVGRRFGWWLALTQLAPVVIAAVIGGTLSGVTILLVVGPALGLKILAGGVDDPLLRVETATVAGIIGGTLALLALTLVVDVLAHRRDQPGDVLRVGDTV
jgi:putative ABC transport system permease protein